ncbi:T9SS type A sorting domain-containing protein, partial [bacterium]|nr:T9SS type A sorting domain-containing protein [bacterium]
AGTWEEVSDNVVNTYLDIKFDSSGNVAANNKPTMVAVTFKVDDVENNQEVVVEGRGPLFSWEGAFSDVDSGDSQKAIQIEVDVDSDSENGNQLWISSPVLELNEIRYGGTTDLQTKQTFYWRLRIMDNHGEWSDWIEAGSFSTVKQARPFNITKNNLSIDWNNPFNPVKGDYTKIRYIIEQDEHVTVRIYDISGRLIKTLVDDNRLNNIVYTQIWDGRNEDGNLVASGVYLVNIISGNFTKTEKIVVIK